MTDRAAAALAATRRLRDSAAFRRLSAAEQGALAGDLERIERALGGAPGRAPAPRWGDPYALAQATPADLQRELAGPGAPPAPRGGAQPSAPAAPPARRTVIEQLGDTGAAVDQIDFPGFVAGLVSGTFQAIVDSTAQQLREYAQLVASLSKTADEFGREHVTDDQIRASLAGRHRELRQLALPPGTATAGAGTRLEVTPSADGTTPAWLADYGLDGEELSDELVEGELLAAGRRRVAEERMQTLATMVLMGVNRIVVNDGDIRAKVQISAQLSDKTDAQMATAQAGGGIAGRSGAAPPQLMVSTAKANAQTEAAAKANLTGEVRISFRSETFPLERFADSAAIQLLNRHARWRGDEAAATPGAPTPPAAPTGSVPGPGRDGGRG